MRTYTIHVIETRHQEVAYTVEANSQDEAWQKAASGDTCEEAERGSYEVCHREPLAGSLVEMD